MRSQQSSWNRWLQIWALFRRQTDSWSFCVRSQNITGHFSSLTRSSPAFVWHWRSTGVFSYYAGFVHVWKDYRWRYAGRRVWWKRGYHAYGFPDYLVYQAGTLSGNPIATAAGLATLRILEADTDIYMRLQENTAMLADAVRHAAGNRVHVNQIGSLMSIFFTGEDVTDYDSATTADTKAYADYFGFMLDHGIYVAPSQFESMFVSDAHTDADIQKTIHVMQEYFAE